MRPEGGHVILLDLHLVALEVGELVQADLVLQAVLQGGEKKRENGGYTQNSQLNMDLFYVPVVGRTMRMGLKDTRQSLR